MNELDSIRRRPHIVALRAGGNCYIYSGYNHDRVRDRAQLGQVGMTAANLDTNLTWLQPDHFHETYKRLCDAVGYPNVHLMPYPIEGRWCLRCGADLNGVMGVYVFIHGRPVSDDEALLCVEHGKNGGNNLTKDEYLSLRAAAEERPV